MDVTFKLAILVLLWVGVCVLGILFARWIELIHAHIYEVMGETPTKIILRCVECGKYKTIVKR